MFIFPGVLHERGFQVVIFWVKFADTDGFIGIQYAQNWKEIQMSWPNSEDLQIAFIKENGTY